MKDPVISVQNFRKAYGDLVAVDGISFEVLQGEIFGLLGPNGAGKTTLLKIIASLILPDKGRVIVNGCRLGIDDDKIKSFIGMVSSHPLCQ